MSTTAAPVDHAWVQAAPFRAHLQCLVANSGLPWRVVALAAGLEPPPTPEAGEAQPITALASGRGRILPALEGALHRFVQENEVWRRETRLEAAE